MTFVVAKQRTISFMAATQDSTDAIPTLLPAIWGTQSIRGGNFPYCMELNLLEGFLADD